MIDIEHLYKSYHGKHGYRTEVLKDVSLQVPASTITAVVGPSGAGKSTLARCISLLEKPDRGTLRVNGNDLSLLTLPRALNSVDAAIGYVSPFDAGKIPREKGILFPPAPATFASQRVIGTPYLAEASIVKLQQAFSDPRLQQWLKETDDPSVKGVLVPVSAE